MARSQITVVDDRRVVDHGKLLKTGGLSAGIDGALRMTEVFDSHEAAQSVEVFIDTTGSRTPASSARRWIRGMTRSICASTIGRAVTGAAC